MKYTRNIAHCLVALFCIVAVATAEVPNQISYQGRLTDSEGAPVPDGDYNLTFQIVEHDPVPMGESPLWSSGVQAVTVTDGLFVYYLGSNVPLPASVFNDDGLESHYLRFALEGSPVYSAGIRLASAPFAYRAMSADTAAYAHAGPGSGATGWVDDGSVVRLQSSGDRVGIGTSSPSENLVVGGGDLGGYEGAYIVSANSEWDDYSGFKLGWNADNHATINWHGDGDQLRFSTRSLGTSYNNTMTMRAGHVGINNDYPDEPLVIGAGFGASFGDMIQISRTGTGRYSGMMFGEDSDNRGQILWYNNSNELRLGYFSGGTNYTSRLVLKNNQMIVNGDPVDASVQLPTGSISNVEIANEAGFAGSSVDSLYVLNDPQPANPTVLDSVIIDAPGTGIVIIIASAQVNCYYDPDNQARVQLDVSKTKTPDEEVYVGVFASPFSVDASLSACVTDYYVVSAGTTIFYFLATRDDPPTGDPVHVRNPRMVAIYSPTWYGAGQSSAAKSETDATFDTGIERSVSVSAGESALFDVGHVADLRAEFNSKLKAMEEKFQRKLAELENNK